MVLSKSLTCDGVVVFAMVIPKHSDVDHGIARPSGTLFGPLEGIIEYGRVLVAVLSHVWVVDILLVWPVCRF